MCTHALPGKGNIHTKRAQSKTTTRSVTSAYKYSIQQFAICMIHVQITRGPIEQQVFSTQACQILHRALSKWPTPDLTTVLHATCSQFQISCNCTETVLEKYTCRIRLP